MRAARPARAGPIVLALALVLVYGARTVTGWVGGAAYASGRRLAEADRYEQALPLLARGALGPDRAAALWLAGNLELNLLQADQARNAKGEQVLARLQAAYHDETEAISLSPASGWYWASLADVYHQIERRARYLHGVPLELVEQDPWAAIGRPGRVAVGLLRQAIALEPTQYVFLDQLAFALLHYGLREEALEVVRESARVQPDFEMHYYTNLRPVPPDILDAFADAARSALGRTPLLRHGLHLVALGKIELRRGRADQAERDLRAALAVPATEANRADISYNLGRALSALGRYEEADAAFRDAEPYPVFAAAGRANRARIAEARDDLDQALALMQEARRLEPRSLEYALEYARLARRVKRPEWAEEALRWAILVHPEDPRPLRELERLLRDSGNAAEAEETRQALERLIARISGSGS